MVSAAAQAMALFLVTSIDDLIVLSLFFGRGRGRPGTTRRIFLGQYLGFLGSLSTAVVIALGAQVILPAAVLPYFGLIPLALGTRAAW